MRWEQVSDPSVEPLLLAEAKQHLRIEHHDSDTELASIISAARAHIEAALDLHLIARQINLYLDTWAELQPCRRVSQERHTFIAKTQPAWLCLPIRPVYELASIHIKDANATETEWASNRYQLLSGLQPKLRPVSGESWPSVAQTQDGIRIQLNSGFGDSWNNIPSDIRQALLMIVTYMTVNKGDGDAQMGSIFSVSGVKSLLAPYAQRRL